MAGGSIKILMESFFLKLILFPREIEKTKTHRLSDGDNCFMLFFYLKQQLMQNNNVIYSESGGAEAKNESKFK